MSQVLKSESAFSQVLKSGQNESGFTKCQVSVSSVSLVRLVSLVNSVSLVSSVTLVRLFNLVGPVSLVSLAQSGP